MTTLRTFAVAAVIAALPLSAVHGQSGHSANPMTSGSARGW